MTAIGAIILSVFAIVALGAGNGSKVVLSVLRIGVGSSFGNITTDSVVSGVGIDSVTVGSVVVSVTISSVGSSPLETSDAGP